MARIKSLDVLKGIGIAAVMIIHAVQPEDVPAVPLYWQILDEMCAVAVPCFFLVAGFLFMRSWQQHSDHGPFIRHYAGRILIPFIFWAFFYAIIPPFVSGAPHGVGPEIWNHLINIVRYPHAFLRTGYIYHLWFLSSLLQAALLTAVSLRLAGLRIALLAGAIFYSLALLGGSYAQTAVGFHTHLDMKTGPFVSTLFFAIGAWLEQRRRAVSLPPGLILLGIGLVSQIAEAALLHQVYGRPMIAYGYLVGTIPYAVGTMLLALSRPDVETWVAEIGKYSLGLFTLHPYVIEVLLRLPFGRPLSNIPPLFAALVLLITYVIVRLLSEVKWVRPVVV